MGKDRQLNLPDVARNLHPEPQGTLDWVGMSEIASRIQIADGDVNHQVAANVQLYIDLSDAHAKGIHMSRLYRSLRQYAAETTLSPKTLAGFLALLKTTHPETSTQASAGFEFDLLLNRPSLISSNEGFNRYPVKLVGRLDENQVHIELELVVHYSSTCPASAALSRSLIQDQFEADFKETEAIDIEDVKSWLGSQRGIVATPHGQRSAATVKILLDESEEAFPLKYTIDLIEEALGTPVQTAVKREDEQEFAYRNGQNPMFCEDAARYVKAALLKESAVKDFRVHVEHFESLHAHNAVAIVAKGLENGYRA